MEMAMAPPQQRMSCSGGLRKDGSWKEGIPSYLSVIDWIPELLLRVDCFTASEVVAHLRFPQTSGLAEA